MNFVDRKASIKDIDKSVKNKWNWNWLDKTVHVLPLSIFIRKIDEPGIAFCVLCKANIKYGGKGFGSIRQHCERAPHKKSEDIKKANRPLPGKFGL